MNDLSFGFPVALLLLPFAVAAWAFWVRGRSRSRRERMALTRRGRRRSR